MSEIGKFHMKQRRMAMEREARDWRALNRRESRDRLFWIVLVVFLSAGIALLLLR